MNSQNCFQKTRYEIWATSVSKIRSNLVGYEDVSLYCGFELSAKNSTSLRVKKDGYRGGKLKEAIECWWDNILYCCN